jgi:acetyl esterase/lipase
MQIESNVVYGMISGLALLMDVYRPEAPNGYGIVHVSGSGWSAPLGLDARPLKESPHVQREGQPLVEAGYTLFTINHRALPRYHYPDPVLDAQRAVRFVRHHAQRYGIDPEQIGAIGGSSGGHLVSMLGVLDGAGDPEAESPIDRLSAKVQCVVARAAPFLFEPGQREVRVLFLNAILRPDTHPGSLEARRAREASPVTHVSPGDPPFLLIHGEADDTVPIRFSEAMYAALRQAGVPVRLRRVPGAGHGPGMLADPEGGPDLLAEIVAWFDEHLLGS